MRSKPLIHWLPYSNELSVVLAIIVYVVKAEYIHIRLAAPNTLRSAIVRQGCSFESLDAKIIIMPDIGIV